ncbi:DUF6376 family protein [Paenibacillus sp. YYML68]|uniref:DUF6376 family protein n=1 Tax=Paenibacillus sp. YYML68 TaxID=2909250 RepID=UPI00249034C7|nr:DUF6376 family protein [Paenibacillus sp. YYML68]
MTWRLTTFILAAVLTMTMLTGCSLLEGVNRSVSYAEQATTYMNDAASFAERVQTIAQQAAADPEARERLKQELLQMKDKIVQFNALEAPPLAKELHSQLVALNETLLTDINRFLEQINQKLDLQAVQDSQIFQTIQQITQIMQKLEQLGLM